MIIKNDCECGEEQFAPMNLGYNDTFVKLSKERIIFVTEIVTKQLSADLSTLLLNYDNDSDDIIEMYINSPGGDVSALINIYDIMQMIASPIKTICMGKCYSAAAVMLAAGTPGERYAFKSSNIMIHGMQAKFPIPGYDITNSKTYYSYLKNSNIELMKILATHTKQPLEKIQEDCKRDLYLSAKEAKEYNLIDHIL